MAEGIAPEELPRWVPGDLLLRSDPDAWSGVSLRSYRYRPLDCEVPPLRDYMIVAYRRGPTPMDRKFDGRWSHEDLVPGDVSLLTRSAKSHWTWTRDIEVVHLYLTQELVNRVCGEIVERDVKDVELLDVLRADDPGIHQIALAIASEVEREPLGGRLYVEALATQLCIRLLRRYAAVHYRESGEIAGLSARQARDVRDFVDANLERNPSLAALACVAGTSVSHFARQFRLRFGLPPHAYVIERRVERAKALLARGELSIKEIAASAGFADQSHLTRAFHRRVGTTPADFRKHRFSASGRGRAERG
jgi:AraC family transcriptional regulator